MARTLNARADAQKTGERPGHEHQTEAGRHLVNVIVAESLGRREMAVEAEPGRQRIGRIVAGLRPSRPAGKIGRQQQGETEHHGNNGSGNPRRQVGAGQGADRGGDLQEHVDPDIRVPFLNVRGRRPRRRGDHRNQRGADSIAQIDAEDQGQQRHQHNPAPQPGQGTNEAGGQRTQADQSRELQDG
jgi:hypothetical protein